jgi:hypothetical protein
MQNKLIDYIQINVLNKFYMRKRRPKLLNNHYITPYHMKLIKEQRYFSKVKLYD